MKKLTIFVSEVVMVCLLIMPAWASKSQNSGEQTVQSEEAGESAVSQSQIDTQNKRAEARKQHDMKLKVRAKNIQKAPRANNDLFQHSK